MNHFFVFTPIPCDKSAMHWLANVSQLILFVHSPHCLSIGSFATHTATEMLIVLNWSVQAFRLYKRQMNEHAPAHCLLHTEASELSKSGITDKNSIHSNVCDWDRKHNSHIKVRQRGCYVWRLRIKTTTMHTQYIQCKLEITLKGKRHFSPMFCVFMYNCLLDIIRPLLPSEFITNPHRTFRCNHSQTVAHDTNEKFKNRRGNFSISFKCASHLFWRWFKQNSEFMWMNRQHLLVKLLK